MEAHFLKGILKKHRFCEREKEKGCCVALSVSFTCIILLCLSSFFPIGLSHTEKMHSEKKMSGQKMVKRRDGWKNKEAKNLIDWVEGGA